MVMLLTPFACRIFRVFTAFSWVVMACSSV